MGGVSARGSGGARSGRWPGGLGPVDPTASPAPERAGGWPLHRQLDRVPLVAPAAGPLPDKYLILGSGTVASSVAGTVTSYRQASLTPATAYQYRVVAVRGGKRSPGSAVLTVRTLTPPISQARLHGSWQVYAKNIGHVPGGRNGYMSWQLSPACATGACDVMLHVKDGRFSFKMKLARAGAVYRDRPEPASAGAGQVPARSPTPQR